MNVPLIREPQRDPRGGQSSKAAVGTALLAGLGLFRNVLPFGRVLRVALLACGAWYWLSHQKQPVAEGYARDASKTLRIPRKKAQLAHFARIATLGDMAGALGHELAQPLSAVSSFTMVALAHLNKEHLDREKLREAVQNAHDQALRASEIVKRLNRFIAGRAPEHAVFDLNEAVHEALALTRPLLQRKNSRVKLDLSVAVPPIVGDNIQVQQVIVNLLRNAVDAIAVSDREEGVIEIATRPSRDGVQLSLSDNGPGLPRDTEKIFHSFFTTKPGGLGLGLSISRMIISAHGGRLWGENRPTGGATFFVTLPAARGVHS